MPGATELPARYVVATVADSEESELARAWLDLVTGDAGRRTLEEAGFGPAATGP